jgi:LysM repeat protein
MPRASATANTPLNRRPVSLATVAGIAAVVILVLVGGVLLFLNFTPQGQELVNPPTETATPTSTAPPTPTFTPTPTETLVPTITPLPPLDYTIRSGDSCISIAFNANVSVASIIAANQGAVNADCTNLVPGNIIKLPQPTVTPTPLPSATLQAGADFTPAPQATYTVKAGETLAGIAKFYGLQITDLLEANGLNDPNNIQAGKILIIPLDKVVLPGDTPTPTVPPLYPAVQLLSPPDGAKFSAGASVVLQWANVTQLRPNEAYQVTVVNVSANNAQVLRAEVTDSTFVIPASFLPSDVTLLRWSVVAVRQRPSSDAAAPAQWEVAGVISAERGIIWLGGGTTAP